MAGGAGDPVTDRPIEGGSEQQGTEGSAASEARDGAAERRTESVGSFGARDDAGGQRTAAPASSISQDGAVEPQEPDGERSVTEDGRAVPDAPPAAEQLCGPTLPLMRDFAVLLASTGVDHGLIGPREVPRLWDRHLLNCAVIQDAFPAGARVLDIGSGAGLPGLAVAIVRPDLHLVLVEPMLRRTTWLEEAVGSLGLDNVSVVRGRAEELKGTLRAPWATARAVAALDRLARWTFPLLEPGGTLVAMKGALAAEELQTHSKALRRAGMTSATVTVHGEGVLEPPSITVDLVRR